MDWGDDEVKRQMEWCIVAKHISKLFSFYSLFDRQLTSDLRSAINPGLYVREGYMDYFLENTAEEKQNWQRSYFALVEQTCT
jgi:hypothetical protein